MKVHLQYGRDGLEVELPTGNVKVVEPTFLPGLPDEGAAFREAMRSPIGTPPLKDLFKASDRIAVVIPDITRPLPTDRLLPWLFAELSHVPAERFVIVNGTGSHRVNSPNELDAMVGAEVAKKYKIVNHDSLDPATLAYAGKGDDGFDVLMNKDYVQADKRIVMGFIEPHFMAGFSGGYKGIFPAVAGIDAIQRYHNAPTIGHPNSTWGLLEGNPTQAKIRHNGSLLPVDFCVNLTLNNKRQITKFFCGHPLKAHLEGCAFAKKTAMVRCEKPFPIVITTNGGYPLDQNLYQAVKGMSAAAQIISKDGYILDAARCNDGFPNHGAFRELLFKYSSPREMLDAITTSSKVIIDQWTAQLLAQILLKCRVGYFGEIPADQIKRAGLEHVADIGKRVSEELARIGKDAPVAVLPEGPMTIPYVES